MSQGALPGVQAAHGTRDPLGRCYTPPGFASALVEALAATGPAPAAVVEPSVGGGTIGRAALARWPQISLTVVDIDPEAEGLRLVKDGPCRVVGDWPMWCRLFPTTSPMFDPPFDLAVGNPPFGKIVSNAVTIEHVVSCLATARRTALVLPLAVLGVAAWGDAVLGRHPPIRVWRVLPRPWGARVREVAVFEWQRNHVGKTTIERLRWRRG